MIYIDTIHYQDTIYTIKYILIDIIITGAGVGRNKLI